MTTRRSIGTRALHALLVIGVVLSLAVVATGCGSKSSSSNSSGGSAQSQGSTQSQNGSTGSSQAQPKKVRLAKTKFVLHSGLAFGAFHRYVYKPFRNGGFTPPRSHKAAIVKAGVAALFAYHETKLALNAARSSPLLSKLLSPILSFQTKLKSLASGLKSGKVDPAAINAANSDTKTLGSQSSQAGAPIKDLPTPSLGG